MPGAAVIARRQYQFTPAELQPIVWLDASDAATLYQDSTLATLAAADADPVGGWKDKSGNARHVTQATSTRRGTLKLAIQNGLPVVRFDGVDDTLFSAAFDRAFLAPAVLAVVGKCRVVAATDANFVDGIAASNRWIVGRVAAGTWRFYCGTGNISGGAADAIFNQLVAVTNGNSSILRSNRVQLAAGATGAQSLTGIRLATDPTGAAQRLDGDIGEILVFPGLLSDGQLSQLEAYLRAKWGLP